MQQYFAILGKNIEISLQELKLAQIHNTNQITKNIILFDSSKPSVLSQLGGIIKRGVIVPITDISTYFEGKKIIGVEDEDIGIMYKRKYSKSLGLRRYKKTTLTKTDKEIKKKGVELIKLQDLAQYRGVVLGYQNIPLYESIDYDKPDRDMQMGMMPAKLAHIMINIGLQNNKNNSKLTIYDPFVGSGTTGFLANYYKYNFLGSDINIQHIQKNLPRWQNTKFYNPDYSIDIFKHDITQNLANTPVQDHKLLIVTEGRLGHIVTNNTSTEQIIQYQKDVINIYQQFIRNIALLKNPTIITTIPWYFGQKNEVQKQLKITAEQNSYKLYAIPEVYSRAGQKVGRKILILTHNSV